MSFLISTPARNYRVSPDDDVPTSRRRRVWIQGQAVDEVTGLPLRSALTLSLREAGLSPQVAQDGLFGVHGIAFLHLAGLNAAPRVFHLRLSSPGYLPRSLTVVVPQTAGFPIQLPAVVDLGAVAMHRTAVVLSGRIVRDIPHSLPVGGATVRVTAVELTLPPSNTAPTWSPPRVIAIRPALSISRSSAGVNPGHGGIITVTPVPNQDKRLRRAAAPAGNRIQLDNRQGLTLNGGDVLGIDADDPDRVEFVATVEVHGSISPDAAAEVVLALPLAQPHLPGALVQCVTVSVPTVDQALARDALEGDRVIFPADLAGWGTAAAVAIQGGGPVEYHAVSRFVATTDADGYYRLPPISRVAAVRLEAQQGAQTQTVEWSLDYTHPFNQVNFRL